MLKKRPKLSKSIRKTRNSKLNDSLFILKAVIYFIVGSNWLWISRNDNLKFFLPLGLILGILMARHEHFVIDRKIEYVILIFAAIIGYVLTFGINIIV